MTFDAAFGWNEKGILLAADGAPVNNVLVATVGSPRDLEALHGATAIRPPATYRSQQR
jgi:hypothetical protein